MKKIIRGLLLTIVLFSILAFTPPTANYTTDAYTVLLIHGDQPDGTAGTDILDSETTPKTITAVGNAQVDTAQYKDLTGSTGSILFDGTGDACTLLDSLDWCPAAGDYTVDFWLKTSQTDQAGISGQLADDGSDPSWYFQINITANKISYYSKDTAGHTITSTTSINDGNWHHIAGVIASGVMTLYVDGVSEGTPISGLGSILNSGSILGIGRLGAYDAIYYAGWIDEFRISKGIARDWVAATRRIIIISKGLWKNFYWKYIRRG